MSTSSHDGDTESFSPRYHQCPKPHSHRSRRARCRRQSLPHPNEDHSIMSHDSGNGGGCTSGSGTSGTSSSGAGGWHGVGRFGHHSHSFPHPHNGHGRYHGHAHYHHHSVPPPGCKDPPIFANPLAPHGHHVEHDHNAYSRGYAFGYPSYPEAHWAGLGERVGRTTVFITDEATERTYVCRTDMIKNYLPNSRAMDIGRIWDVTEPLSETIELDPHHLAALNSIFKAMQEADRTNHFDMFSTLRYNLQHHPAHPLVLNRAVRIVGGMGEVLSWDRGLGCNDVMLGQIEAFILEIIVPVRRLMPGRGVLGLVSAIGYLWRPDDRHKAVLKTIWENLDGFEREDIKESFKKSITEGRGMAFSRMFTEIENF